MTSVAPPVSNDLYDPTFGGAQPVHSAQNNSNLRSVAKRILGPLIGLWMISGGFILIDPSPYEFVFLLVLPVAIWAGISVHRANTPIFLLMVAFTPFALIGAFQVNYIPVYQAIFYVIVTIYLWFTIYFVANYVADAPQKHMKLMMQAYTFAALFAAIIGTLAYLRILPDFGQLLEHGRVRSTFKDPNVYAPFVIVAAAFALQRALMHTGRRALVSALVYGILFIGVFASFSRAAWGLLVLSSFIVFVLSFMLDANPKDRVRMISLAMVGAVVLLGALVALLSIDSVRALFLERASLIQSYDGGSTGRFGRQAYAFELAMAHPWGIGPLEFRNLRIVEEPHNTYVNVLHAYGWGGAFAYYALIWLTIKRATACLLRPSPNRLILVPLVAILAGTVIESAIIDTDHWRHYYLIIGMIWGVCTGYDRTSEAQKKRVGCLV